MHTYIRLDMSGACRCGRGCLRYGGGSLTSSLRSNFPRVACSDVLRFPGLMVCDKTPITLLSATVERNIRDKRVSFDIIDDHDVPDV